MSTRRPIGLAYRKSETGKNARRTTMQHAPRQGVRAFTLVEVLAALLLIAIVLPVVMKGVSLATATASTAKRRTEASGLAESKLNELIATGTWQNGNLAGDFSPDWPDYKWQAVLANYASDTSGQNVQELDLTVTWTANNAEQSVLVSTLVYAKAASTTSD